MGSLCGLAHEVFEFGKDLLNRVQIGAIGRQKDKARPLAPDGLAHRLALVAGKVVHDHDIAFVEGWGQLMGDIGKKGLGVDRAIIDPWCIDPVMAKSGDKGHGFPMTMGREPLQALPFRGPAAQGSHVGLGPCFVDKDQTGRINPTLILFPALPEPRHLCPLLFDCQRGFF